VLIVLAVLPTPPGALFARGSGSVAGYMRSWMGVKTRPSTALSHIVPDLPFRMLFRVKIARKLFVRSAGYLNILQPYKTM
jgi:hypothetical protein